MDADQYRTFIKEILPPLGYQWRRFDRRNTRRKVKRRMECLGIHEPAVYAELVLGDPEEAGIFESLLPVTVTRFFRNAWLWSDLGDLFLERDRYFSDPSQELKLWSAGCAGGEEAFTAAMLLDDLLERGLSCSCWKVLGTDIDSSSLDRSRNAQYRWGAVREVPERIRQHWFTEDKGTWTLSGEIRSRVTIRFHDIIRQKPPGLFHVVLLRNSIFTYNTEDVQREVLKKIRACLLDPGLLIVGRTEKVPEGTGFEEIRRCIYKKVQSSGPA